MTFLSLGPLGILLRRVSGTRRRDRGLDRSQSLYHDAFFLRRTFGPEIAGRATWKEGSDLVSGDDRLVVLDVAGVHFTLAYRHDADGDGNPGFDVRVPCPTGADRDDDDPCGPAWMPAYSATDLLRAYLGQHETGDGLICEGCGYEAEIDYVPADWEAAAGTTARQAQPQAEQPEVIAS